MDKAPIIFLLTVLAPHVARGESPLRQDLEQIYLTVFERAVAAKLDANRVHSIAIAEERTAPGNESEFAALPSPLETKLMEKLKAKGTNIEAFVPIKQVVRQKFEKDGTTYRGPLVDSKSGKDTWVYVITGIQWYGDDKIYVAHMIYHGSLAAGGSTSVLEKKNGRWEIVDEVRSWVS